MNKEENTGHQEEQIQDIYKAFTSFVEEFKAESDRAAVILGAAKLDYLLYQVLSKYLLPSVGSRDELLEGDAALATFSSRINICYRLGLIDGEFARALHLIRKIRNSFAHEVSGCKLDTGPHRDRVRELAAPFIKHKRFIGFKRAFIKGKTGASADFFTVLALMIARLEGMFNWLEPLTGDDSSGVIVEIPSDSQQIDGNNIE